MTTGAATTFPPRVSSLSAGLGRSLPRPSAFTLLEIMLAVGIAVIFMGGAVVFLSSVGGDEDLERARRILEIAAGAAREEALRSGIRQRVILGTPGEGRLLGWLTRVDSAAYGDWAFPPEVEMSVLRPHLSEWGKPELMEWEFTGGGLVEPIRIRLKHGSNQDQFSFNALTGESQTEVWKKER